jgi:hypothetical protein
MYAWSHRYLSFSLASCLAAQSIAVPQPSAPRETAILQIRVVEGEGAVHAAGSRATRGLIVEVTDETGKPVGGAAVNFRLPDEGPGGLFANGMKTEVVITTPDGRAALWGMQWNRVEGPLQIRITAAKGQARAGTVASQYLSQAVAAKQTGVTKTSPASSAGKPRGKWLWIGLVAAGTAVGCGMAAGLVKSSKTESTTLTAPTTPALTVGTPSITFGKP